MFALEIPSKMPALHKVRGIVLKSYPLLETDLLGRLLTDSDNCLPIRAHGLCISRKRSPILLEPGTLVKMDYYISRTKLATLKEGHVENRFAALKSSYPSLLLLSYLLELTTYAVSHGETPNLFLLVHGSLQELCHCHKEDLSSLELIVFFQVRLIKLMGLLGSSNQCSRCEQILSEKAQWNLPEVHFSCCACASKAEREDFIMAEVLNMVRANRFHRFKSKVEQKFIDLSYQKEQTKKIFIGFAV